MEMDLLRQGNRVFIGKFADPIVPRTSKGKRVFSYTLGRHTVVLALAVEVSTIKRSLICILRKAEVSLFSFVSILNH